MYEKFSHEIYNNFLCLNFTTEYSKLYFENGYKFKDFVPEIPPKDQLSDAILALQKDKNFEICIKMKKYCDNKKNNISELKINNNFVEFNKIYKLDIKKNKDDVINLISDLLKINN